MHCYCFNELKSGNIQGLFDIDFTAINPEDTRKYCKDWFYAYSKALSLKYGAPMVIIIINVLVPIVFAAFSKFEKHKTLNEETLGTF